MYFSLVVPLYGKLQCVLFTLYLCKRDAKLLQPSLTFPRQLSSPMVMEVRHVHTEFFPSP